MAAHSPLRDVECAEADQAAAAMSGVEVEAAALSRATGTNRIVELDLGYVCLKWARMGVPVCLTGEVRPGAMFFSVADKGSGRWALNGLPMQPSLLAWLAPGAAYTAAMGRGARWMTMRIDAAWFMKRHGRQFDIRGEPVQFFVPARARLRPVRQAFDAAWALLHGPSAVVRNAGMRRQLEARFVAAVLEATRGAPRVTPSYSRHAFLLRHLHGASADHAMQVEDLRSQLRMGERTLRRVFSDLYGVSPARYLRTRRLNQARRALRAGGMRSVTEIAMSLGFSDLGRFAAHYRSLFGELPSDTLRGLPPAEAAEIT
jgi:AraC-like DNA-binding protein